MTIRCIFQVEPNFPAIDQHPDASRYTVWPYIVDAIGEPTLAEVEAKLGLDAAGLAAAARIADDVAEQATVKADNQVQTFLNFTPAQLDNWVDNNIVGAATLAALRTACGTAFKVLGRIALAAGRGRFLR